MSKCDHALYQSRLNDTFISDPLTMVKCEPFAGKPGSDIPGCQPFELQVHSNVLLAMDFHAHLMTTEIIGFLAGEWDKEKRRKLMYCLCDHELNCTCH